LATQTRELSKDLKSAASAAPGAKSGNDAPFPFLDLKAQYATIREEILKTVEDVLRDQHFIMGPQVATFEHEFERETKTRFALGCASGSDAILLALMAYDIGPGDEIITTPFTFVATAGSIARLRAKPVFVDIDPATFNLDVSKIAAAVTSKTRAIMPVHLFGLPSDLDPIMKIAAGKFPVIEDAAQAIGAEYHGQPVGGIGEIGCFSFFPSKNLGGAGDGGMLTTNSEKLADKLKVLRIHGSRTKYLYELLGMNSRLDTLQAAILSVKMKHLAKWAEGRRRNADRYRALIKELGLQSKVKPPEVPAGFLHVYNQFVIRVPRRDELKTFLKDRGIPTEIYYPSPLHLQPAFKDLGYKEGDFPQSEAASKEVLALPIYPELTEAQQRRVVQSIADFFGSAR
jgi:dTDP-4-amino-4,6-dideoxygalactose transaminase